ncbi:MAG: NAD(P)H-hydrate dehydratase [Candidatus Bathyarchaeota archaeon]|nr:NAD(P)H-hydrate dehydratase [Candidatus Bathyarchaeota archaeon]
MVKLKIITTKEMQALDINAEYFGISRLQLMENAGRNIALEISARFKPKEVKVAIFCGLGGNGGDGFVAARHLACLGFTVDVILAGRASQIVNKEAGKNWRALESLRDFVALYEICDSSLIPEVKAGVVVDALLGTGLKGHPRTPILQFIKRMNEMNAFRLAVDIPSGIDSDTGEVLGEAVKADATIALHKAKPGLKKAKKHVGEIIVKPIGLPQEIERFAGPGDVSVIMKPRPSESHKGDFGRLLVIGGSEKYSGAPTLAALAALRTGVDLAIVAAPRETAYVISSLSPDLITVKLEGERLNVSNLSVVRRNLERATGVIIGPGLGLHKETQEAVDEIVKVVEANKIPMLLDADGLKAFAGSKRRIETPAVLTPHAGEYQMLTGSQLPDGFEERAESVRRTAQDLDAVILLKSHVDVVSDGYKVKTNFTGNPGMTVGGTGDVLSGVVGAFLAQGVAPFEAAVAGAFINGAAGDFVKAEKGYHMVASDLLDWIPKVVNDPMCHLNLKKGWLPKSS